MRPTLLGLVVALGLSVAASDAHAQVPFSNINDPFFAYYAFYLPRQQAQALSPGPEATIDAINANRQQYAATNRTDMFDPRGAAGDLDGSDEFTPNAGRMRRTVSNGLSANAGRLGAASRLGGNLNGLGPKGHFNAANQYYPGLRAGRGKNVDVAVRKSRSSRFGGGMGGGLPGPR